MKTLQISEWSYSEISNAFFCSTLNSSVYSRKQNLLFFLHLDIKEVYSGWMLEE